MPLMYESVLSEHMYVRVSAAVFDLSYLGRIEMSGPGHVEALQRHLTRRVEGSREGRSFYALMLTSDGTISADCMVFVLRNRVLLSVNPLNTEKVLSRLAADAPNGVTVRDVTDALLCISVQGRRAPQMLQRLTDMNLSHLATGYACECYVVGGCRSVLARTGYTGEDGFEVMLPPSGADVLWEALLEVGTHEHLVPAGTGARNSLRLEACFPLYGAEIDETTDPLEADLERFVEWDHDFRGREALEERKKKGPSRKLVALKIDGRRIARAGYPLFDGGRRVGTVTRGSYSPVMRQPIATAYVEPDVAGLGRHLVVEVRGHRQLAFVSRKPMYLRKSSLYSGR